MRYNNNMKILVLALSLSLGSMTSKGFEGIKMENVINYTQVSIRGTGVVVYNPGTDRHGGIRISLSFKEDKKGNLTFSASNLSAHPDLIVPKFSSDIERFDHFQYYSIDEHISYLTAHLQMSANNKRIRMVSIGPICNDNIKTLKAFLLPHGIGLWRKSNAS